MADQVEQQSVRVVLLVAFSEEVAIGSIVIRSLKFADKVTVIDDSSKDYTAEVARLAGAKVLSRRKNEGKVAGIRDSFLYA